MGRKSSQCCLILRLKNSYLASSGCAQVTIPAESPQSGRGRQSGVENGGNPSPQSANVLRARSASLTPEYSPMQISPLPSSWPLQPLNRSGSGALSKDRPTSTAGASSASGTATAADKGEGNENPWRPGKEGRSADSTAALELLADCAAAEAATSRKAKGADSLQVIICLISSPTDLLMCF